MNEIKALVWELTLVNGNDYGVRLLVSGNAVASQVLRHGNERPRWGVQHYATLQDAIAVATAYTRQVESDWQGQIAVAPVEVMVHPSEQARLVPGEPIPPALRARCFTALDRGRKAGAVG